MTLKSADLLLRLRATAEPTRLRLLAVLARGELSVSELTSILGQSQPRVSRHLKCLDDCGLLERFREQHWIYYRMPTDTEGGQFARLLLGMLEADDPVLAGDQRRLQRVLEIRAGRGGERDAVPDAEATDDLVSLIEGELGTDGAEALLYFGHAPEEVLGARRLRARRVVGMNPSRLVVQRARAVLHSAGFNDCALQQGDLAALPQPANSFDVVLIDRVLVRADRPTDGLHEAARVLRPTGRVVLIEDFEALERHTPDANPLALLREWLADAGLTCDRLRPFDVSGAHLLLATATPESARAAA